MTPHKILKTFPGSQHGNDHDVFEKGTVRLLSDGLAEIVVKAGWAEPTDEVETTTGETSEGPNGSEATPTEEKAVADAPENKAKKAAPSNKGKKAA